MINFRPLAAGLAALLLPLGAGAAHAQATVADQGRDLLERNCAMCHAVGVTGDSPNSIAPAFREMHTRYPIDNLAEALGEGILTGHPQMPQFTFDADEVQAILTYLKSIQTRQGAVVPPVGTDAQKRPG